MKTNATNSVRYFRQTAKTGFSLVELVVVVALLTLLFAFATPYTLSALQASSLTSSGDTVMQKIALAQMRASTENRVVAVQFYFYVRDGVNACHAAQLVAIDPATNAATPLEEPVYWSDGRVVLLNGPLSPIFANTPAADTGPATQEPFKSQEATVHRVRFYPHGGTSLSVPLRQAYFTMIGSNRFKADLASPPPNYYTIQIDPVAGRARSYRP